MAERMSPKKQEQDRSLVEKAKDVVSNANTTMMKRMPSDFQRMFKKKGTKNGTPSSPAC